MWLIDCVRKGTRFIARRVGNVHFAEAERFHATVNPQSPGTRSQPIALSAPIATLAAGKSYINKRQDTAMSQSLPSHPRPSERLGPYRLVELDGTHESMLSRRDTPCRCHPDRKSGLKSKDLWR
jgi:hypothetical protein